MKKTIKLLPVILMMFVASNLFAQTTPEWVRAYDQPDNRNKLYASITDNEGNTYLTGSSQELLDYNLTSRNFLTLKYDKDGNLLWAKTYDSGEAGEDEAYAIALDKEGNVYVTGFITSPTELEEFYTIKYSPDGEEIWSAIFNGPETGGIKWNDHGEHIYVDDDQNVYVVGIVQAMDDSTYYIHDNIGVVKYNSNGELEYSDVYDSPYHGDEKARNIAVNKFGHLFIAGYTYPQNQESASDMLLLMYDNQGNLRWDVKYDGPDSKGDEALLLTTDKNGYVYLAGYRRTETNGGEADFYIAKYDTNGTIIWDDIINSQISGIKPNTHYPVAMAINKSDNLYIEAYNSGSENFLVKYDLEGNRKWISFWERGSIGLMYNPANIVFDSEANIYLMGNNNPRDSLMNGDVLGAAKFDPQGNKIWELYYEDGIVIDGSSWTNVPIGIGIDKNNAIYLAGRGGGGGGWKAFELVKFLPPIVNVKNERTEPVQFNLEQNYPNPFNPSTTIKYSIPYVETGHASSVRNVTLVVYDMLGREVTTLVNKEQQPGNYQVIFNASSVGRRISSGIYYYRLSVGNNVMTKKCILLK